MESQLKQFKDIIKNSYIESGKIDGSFEINNKEYDEIFIEGYTRSKCCSSCKTSYTCDEDPDECGQCIYYDQIIELYDSFKNKIATFTISL